MSPRAYRLGLRQLSADQTRVRVLAAARELLDAPDAAPALTMDAVAKQAGVARMTVYYQFESKPKLLEALFDDLAQRSLVPALAESFKLADPREALRGFVGAFAGFWAAERRVIRRLNGLASVDAEIERGIAARHERRREGAAEMLRRMHERFGRPAEADLPNAVDVAVLLTGFDAYDSLATGSRTDTEVSALLYAVLFRVLWLPPPASAE
jgi:AcrR family transcriptional regulator